jgi:hypothetical protein
MDFFLQIAYFFYNAFHSVKENTTNQKPSNLSSTAYSTSALPIVVPLSFPSALPCIAFNLPLPEGRAGTAWVFAEK